MLLNHHREGTGEPLVLIHGIGHFWQGWRPVIERLSAEREVIAIDLPGFGHSPLPPAGTPAGITSLTDLVAGFCADIGLERPHVAGTRSAGGSRWSSPSADTSGAPRRSRPGASRTARRDGSVGSRSGWRGGRAG